LKESDATYLCATPERAAFFDSVTATLNTDAECITLAANYIISDLAGISAKRGDEIYAEINPKDFAKLIQLVHHGELSSRGAKDVLNIFVEKGGDPETIAREHNLIQVHDDGVLSSIVDTVLAREEKAVLEYKGGKSATLQYLVGKAMSESRGAGNPESLRKILLEKLG
jgi:aspartyl-tRNA(Asn)/glutamyl-tRNA(Gln) amidotransferase subunit B